MFSKKLQPALPSAVPGEASGLGGKLKALGQLAASNPYVGVGAAGGLFVVAALILLLAGDPHAGAPKVRVALAANATDTAGWRAGQGAEQAPAAAPVDPLVASIDPAETSEAAPGQAVITLPSGERQLVTTSSGRAAALPPAPYAGMTQPGPGGLLPIIAADGRAPSSAYARPFTSNGKPKVAIVIGGLGIKADTTRQAIEALPPEVTLSFAVYAEGLQGWIDLARQYGHEVLLEAPMEPTDYPQNDPGPFTLLANARPDETAKRLDWLLSRATGYFGVTNYMGSRFVTSAGMDAFSAGLRKRGLAFVDDGSASARGGGVPRASAAAIIDDQLAADAIAARLSGLEATAGTKGAALGSGFAYSLTVQQVAAWARGLAQRGYQLAPASALTVRR